MGIVSRITNVACFLTRFPVSVSVHSMLLISMLKCPSSISVIPRINRDDIPATTIRIGQPLKFNVNITGEPPPEVAWFLGDKAVHSDNRISIENPDYLSKFAISKAERKHSGKYRITAKNSSGSDEAEVEVLVLSKPTKPKGPLEVSEVFEDHMTLDWKPPDDDGGAPIDHYEIEKLDTSSGMWVPCGRSKDNK